MTASKSKCSDNLAAPVAGVAVARVAAHAMLAVIACGILFLDVKSADNVPFEAHATAQLSQSHHRTNSVNHADWYSATEYNQDKIGSFSVVSRPETELFAEGMRGAWGNVLEALVDRERYSTFLRNSLHGEIISGGDLEWQIPVDIEAARLQLLEQSSNYAGDYLLETLTGEAKGLGMVRNIDVEYDTGLGGRKWSAGVSAMGALQEQQDRVIAWQLRSYSGEDTSLGVNGGFVFRRSSVHENEKKALAGFNFFIDYERDGETDEPFARWSVGGEYRNDWIGFNANRYIAITDKKLQSDGSYVYSQSGWDAEARFYPDLEDGLDASLSGGWGYYLWQGELGEDDDEGFRFFIAMDRGFSGELLHGLKIELEHDMSTDENKAWAGKLSFTHRFNEPRSSGGLPVANNPFNPKDYFFSPVRREYVQRVRRTAPPALPPNVFVGNGLTLDITWDNTVNLTMTDQAIALMKMSGGTNPYAIAVSGNEGIEMQVRSASATGTPATLIVREDYRLVSSEMPLSLTLILSDSAVPTAASLTAVISIVLQGERGNYHLISQNGINLGILGSATVTAKYSPFPLAEVFSFGDNPPISVSAVDNGGAVDITLQDNDSESQDLLLENHLQLGINSTSALTIKFTGIDAVTATATGTYTVQVVTENDNFGHFMGTDIRVWVYGDSTVHVVNAVQQLALITVADGVTPYSYSAVLAGAGAYTFDVVPLASGEQALRLTNPVLLPLNSMTTVTVSLSVSDSASPTDVAAGLYTVVLVRGNDPLYDPDADDDMDDEPFTDYIIIGDPNGFHATISLYATVTATVLQQRLAAMYPAGGMVPYGYGVSITNNTENILVNAIPAPSYTWARVQMANSAQVNGTITLTLVFSVTDSSDPALSISGDYTMVVIEQPSDDAELVTGGSIFIIGGDVGSDRNRTDVWVGSGNGGVTWSSLSVIPDAAVTPRSGSHGIAPEAIVFNGSIFVMGLGNKTVLRSADGITWETATSNGAFSAITDMGLLVHKGRLLMIGGTPSGGGETNEVWASEDGVEWLLVEQAPESALPAASAIDVAKIANTIYAVGGELDDELWASSDGGSNWQHVATATDFEGGSLGGAAGGVGDYPQLIAYDDKLYLFPRLQHCCHAGFFGDFDPEHNRNVFYTTWDGSSWSDYVDKRPDSGAMGSDYGAATFIYNDRLYFAGGMPTTSASDNNRIMYSNPTPDNWGYSGMPTPNGAGAPRSLHAIVVFDPDA